MKKRILLLLAALPLCFPLTACGSGGDVTGRMDEMLDDFEDDYQDYLSEAETPGSVLDTLDLMLDHYVSGISTPPPSSITTTPLEPDDEDAQDLVTGGGDTAVANEQELEDLVYQSLKNLETGITFSTTGTWLTSDLLYDIVFYRVHDVYMIDAFGLHSYSVKWTDTGTEMLYELDYTYLDGKSTDEVRQMRDEIEAQGKKIVRDLGLGGKSDYEIVAAIDQYLCDTVYYPDAPYITNDFNPYGAMLEGRAVCEGYARSVKILCELCNVDCYFVTGYCDNDPVNGGHAWNLVNVDSKWYQLDTTWNDGGNSKDYFLVTDDFMTLSRAWDKSKYPASASEAYGS